jgi:trimethylamine--corrinoid protein Co-methyltransferase
MRFLEFLSSDDITKIHLATLDVLGETGIIFQSDKALKILDEAGCIIDYKKQVAKIPSYLVEESIRKAVHKYTVTGRDPKNKIEFGSHPRRTYFSVKVGPTMFYDYKSREYRQCTSQDLVKIVRLANALTDCDAVGAYLCPPSDVPIEVNDLHQVLITMRNSVKPFMGFADNLEGFNDYIKMLCILFGREEEELGKHPIPPGYGGSVNHPLWWGKERIEIIMRAAELGLDTYLSAGGMMGADIPVTLGGALVISNAELLAGHTLVKLINKDTPLYCKGVIRTLDMRDLYVGFGGSNNAISHACQAQIMRHYGIPSSTHVCQDSNTEDEQAGYAKMMLFAIPTLAGISTADGIGSLAAENLNSLAQMVIDNEIIQLVKRMQDKLFNGIGVREDELAVDLIKKVGPGGSFLKEKHTLKHYRDSLWFPPLGRRMPLQTWLKESKPMYRDEAFKVARKIIEAVEIPELPRDIDRELVKVVREAEKREVGKKRIMRA